MTVWFSKSKTGGTSGALDYHNGSKLSDNDGGLIFDLTNLSIHCFILDSDSGETADGEDIIAPVINAGTKRWKRAYFVIDKSKRSVVDVTGTTLSVTESYLGKYLDCYNVADQTLVIDTLDSSHDGAEIYITKMGAGDVIIQAPPGVTFDGTDNQITIGSLGCELKLRYNHARGVLAYSYNGNIIGATI